MATKPQLIEQLSAANDALVRAGRTIEQLRNQVARLKPVGSVQQRLPLANRAAMLTAAARSQIAPRYFEAFPDARSATDDELREFDQGSAS